MGPPSPPGPPSPQFDRAALDRIIQRAAELQTGEREIGDSLTPDEVLQLGKEVGIPAKYLQQAILEQQASAGAAAPDTSFLGRVVGPAEVRAHRVVQGEPEDAIRSLLIWMEKNELLVVQRQQAGWVSWEPLRGMQAAIRRGTASLDTSKPKFMLSRAETVVATVTPLEKGYAHVTVTATLRETRSGYVRGGVAAAVLGLGAATAVGVFAGLGILVAAPLLPAALVSTALFRRFGPVAMRVQLGLERALDFLERGGVKPGHESLSRGPGLLELLAGEVRRAITAGSERGRDARRLRPPTGRKLDQSGGTKPGES